MPKGLSKNISFSHDYFLVFAKDNEKLKFNRLTRTAKMDEQYKNPDNDPRGPYISSLFTIGSITKNRYPITAPGGNVIFPQPGRSWRVSKERFNELVRDNRIYFGRDGNSAPRVKFFLSEASDRMPTT